MVFIPSCTVELSGECLKYLSFTLDQLNQNFWGQGLALLKSSWDLPCVHSSGVSSSGNRLYRALHIGSLLGRTFCKNIYKTVNTEELARWSWTLAVITEVSASVHVTWTGTVFCICLQLRQYTGTPLHLYIHPTLDFSCPWGISVTLGMEALFHWLDFPGGT